MGQKSLLLVLTVSVVAIALLQPILGATISSNDNSGFMESLSTGFKFASKLLGMNQSASVANLVSQAFSGPSPSSAPKVANKPTQNYQYEDNEYSADEKDNYVANSDKASDPSSSVQSQFPSLVEEGLGLFHGSTSTTTSTSAPATSFSGIASLLRILGMDERKLSALMVNGLIFIAQMIQKIIMSPGSSANLFPSPAAAEGKEGRSEDPTEEPFDVWDLILSSPEMKKLLGAAQQSDLPQKLAGFVEGQEMETGGLACVQLLICQMAPVLRKMQKSVADRVQGRESPFNSNFAGSVENTFLSQLPSIEELRDYGHECEKRYSACDLSAIGGR